MQRARCQASVAEREREREREREKERGRRSLSDSRKVGKEHRGVQAGGSEMTSKNTRAKLTSPAIASRICFSLALEACRLLADHATPGGGLASGLSKILRSTDRNKMDMAQASETSWTDGMVRA